MQPLSFESITVDELHLPLLKEKKARAAVLRLDKVHPIISGNKWFKLKYYLEEARKESKDHIITFGGAFSNHIVATAAAGKLSGFKTTGIIRGEEPTNLSHTLKHAKEFGMQLIFISREDYRDKKISFPIDDTMYLVDEGGYGKKGAEGAAEILDHCQKENYTHIACAVGTATMMAGLVKASLPEQEIIGFNVLKNVSVDHELADLLSTAERNKKFSLLHNYHFGGYSKHTPELIHFMNEFYKSTGIPTDFVYTGKLFFGVLDLVKAGQFPKETNLLFIHSGGLQGNLSLSKGTLIF
jgi:1-aminocyclopropane-1-carboxylate deaminase